MATQIKTTTELNEVLEQLTTNMSYGFTSLGNKVSRSAANNMFSNIESSLNALYVKTRLLEDLNSFAESYIQEEFKVISEALQESVRVIRDSADQLTVSRKYNEVISFGNSGAQTTDRDGASLPVAENINDVLLPANEINQSSKNSIIAVTSNNLPYRQQTNPIEQYRSFYCESHPLEKQIVEKIQVLFSRSIPVNYLAISSFRSSIKSLYLINADNNENVEIDLTQDIYVFPEINAKGFVVELACDNYEVTTMDILDMDDSTSYDLLNSTSTESLLDTIFDTLVARLGG